jgi:hypothetical protein
VLRLLFYLVGALVAVYVLSALRPRERSDGPPDPPRSKMTRREALLVLGLAEGATEQQIAHAYRQLVRKVHPDTPGGSAYLTSQINQARDVLLGSS